MKPDTQQYMPDTIDTDCSGNRAFFGREAMPYFYIPELRKRVDELVEAARRSTNRHFVLEGTTLRAAQSSRLSALGYMSPGRILVSIEVDEQSVIR